MSYKRILTIQDISCVGQCSLTVALPILSACGVEASRCSSFSGCGAPALGTWTSAAADVGSVASARGL